MWGLRSGGRLDGAPCRGENYINVPNQYNEGFAILDKKKNLYQAFYAVKNQLNHTRRPHHEYTAPIQVPPVADRLIATTLFLCHIS